MPTLTKEALAAKYELAAVRIICVLNVNFCRQKTSKLRYITTKYKQQICTVQNKTQCKEIEESIMISVRRAHTGEFTATSKTGFAEYLLHACRLLMLSDIPHQLVNMEILGYD